MRVSFDLTPLLAGTTGVARYVTELTRELARQGVSLERFAIGRGADGQLPAGVRRVRVPLRVVHRAWSLLGWPSAERLAPSGQLVHSPDLVPPPTRRPLVMTVHDLDAIEHPDLHPPRAVDLQRGQLEAAARRASVVIAVSQATADALVAHGVEGERIIVAPNGVGPLPAPDGSLVPSEPYFLVTGAVTLRKGLETLIGAFARARLGRVRLVLAGPDGWGAERVGAAIARHAVGERVHRLGRVSDSQLAGLYDRCLAVCLPSVAEGFGLPVLEALAAGAPLAASDLPVFREVAADAALYVPVGETGQWTHALERLAGEEPLGAELAARGPRRAAQFTWERAAALTVEAYRRALGAATTAEPRVGR